MTTKQQERDALKKIRKIVDDLGGKDSYIGIAFQGVFEIAETNIDNDFGDNPILERDNAYEQLKAAKLETEEVANKLYFVEKDIGIRNNENTRLKDRNDEKSAIINTLNSDLIGATLRLEELEKANHDQAAEIVNLKARLYDLLTAESK